MQPQQSSYRFQFLHGKDVCEGIFDGRETVKLPGEFLSIIEEFPQALDLKSFLAHFLVEFGIYLNEHRNEVAVVCYLITLCSILKAQSIEVVKTSESECAVNINCPQIEISCNPIQKWVLLFFELGFYFLGRISTKRFFVSGLPETNSFEIAIQTNSFLLTRGRTK